MRVVAGGSGTGYAPGMNSQERSDGAWMRRALGLARRGWGRTTPNPIVGAIVVRAGREVGRGWHQRAGTPHAEIHALNAAGDQARGATLYVTLEPCCTQGRTPPCTETIVRAGIVRVVTGCTDPNPRHAGRGLAGLRAAGIAVVEGVENTLCRQLNAAFFKWVTTGRPWVVLKLAMTLDGKIATATGESHWITGPIARARVQRLRQWADAILVGGETVRQDDPALTVRVPAVWPRQPRRFVWTRRGATAFPRQLRIWDDPAQPPGFVAAQTADDWRQWLGELGRDGITALAVEGGGELAAACLRAGLVDQVAVFVAPKILGGRDSRSAVGGPAPAALAAAIDLTRCTCRQIGTDFLITGTVCG